MANRTPLVAGMVLCASSAFAHHSLDKTYDLKTEIRMQGRLLQVLLRNPHSFLQLEVPDAQGVPQRWSLEWKGSGSLAKSSILRDTLKPGDALVVTVNPGRTPGDHRGVLTTLQRPSDGLAWDAHPKKHRKS